MPNDPIETLTAEVEIFGIPQAPGMPPMADAIFHIRRRQDGAPGRARLGLPAYEGRRGPAGPPAAIHKGDATTAELTTLAATLTKDNLNWAWRNLDTNDQHVWDGEQFIVYADAYGTPGPTGPPPRLTAGDLTVAGEPVDIGYGLRVNGANGDYTISVDMPPSPKGEPGPPGPAGPILEATDIAPGQTPTDGDTIIVRDGLVHFEPAQRAPDLFTVGPDGFPTQNATTTTAKIDMFTLSIPAYPYPVRLDIDGEVDVQVSTTGQVAVEIRRDSATGALIGLGRTGNGDGWRPIRLRNHGDASITPETTNDPSVIPANTPTTLYVAAVKRGGSLFGWAVRKDYAQLRVKVERV